MPVVVVAPVTYTPTTEVSYNRLKEVPPIVVCPVVDVPPFIGPLLAAGWNCNRCGSDQLYLNPFRDGDQIPLQIGLPDSANADPVNPTLGFKDTGTGITPGTHFAFRLELYDYDCVTVLSDNADDFCVDYWVGFSSEIGPIQTFFIDTSLAIFTGKDMWRVKITAYNSTGAAVTSSWSEVFQRQECLQTVRFLSSHANDDCLGHQYQVPAVTVGPSAPPAGSPTAFFMAWRWRGELIETGTTEERVTNDNDVLLSTKQRRQFKIVFRNIPPYSKRIFDAVKSVSDVQIQRNSDAFDTYQELGDVAKNIDAGNRMFKIITTCTQICDIDEFSCDE